MQTKSKGRCGKSLDHTRVITSVHQCYGHGTPMPSDSSGLILNRSKVIQKVHIIQIQILKGYHSSGIGNPKQIKVIINGSRFTSVKML